MKTILFLILITFSLGTYAQQAEDSMVRGTTVVIKDPRIDIMGKKMAEYNGGRVVSVVSAHPGKGYRLLVVNTGDRDLAMRLRAQLYQLFPDQKQYMSYQLPNIKIKFGNYEDRSEADKMRKLIMDMKLVPNNIYILPEMIEIKGEKIENKP